jgi:hypothetical protein
LDFSIIFILVPHHTTDIKEIIETLVE